ncbi:helix-turn-helix domain-containing protein [Pseudomonas sp.]|uniref:helix-turn-helix domain-containing protein n=1 Tax=Pseudomonas sp. TaxID=306 RepID=UPI0028A5E185|nr:helix-turn-helix domain-containing protein [Pseudomonas sp.]
MFAETRCFTDSQQHAGSIAGWNQVYDQMGRGPLNSELAQVCGTRFQVFRESLDKRVLQHGYAPPDRLCIGIALPSGALPVVQGHAVAACAVALLRGGEEFVVHAPEGLHMLAANLDTVSFARHAARELSTAQLKRLQTASQVAVDPAALARLRARVSALIDSLQHGAQPIPEHCLESSLLEAFLDLFQHADDEVRSRRANLAVSAYLVRRSQELVQQQPEHLLSILDLCAALRVSRRTLQYSFQQVTGLRPVEYLRNLRLNAVRRALLASSAEQCTVSEVAGRLGFFHLSHFATHYRALFAEYPSATRRRAG